MKLTYSLLLLFFCCTFGVSAQQLDKLSKKDLIKISGGMNYSNTIFLSDNPKATRDPFAWYASGNINITAAGMSFPFTYSISNQGKKYSQPANLTSVNPSYKWVKTHIGRVSASFSPYTLSGVNYSGVGVELTPKKFALQAIYGQINKSIEYDLLANNMNSISYRRWAFGMMFSGKIKQIEYKIISLKAYDDPNSLKFVPGESTIKPKDNLVTSLQVKSKLGKAIDIETEVAASLLTENRRNLNPTTEKKWFRFMYPLVDGNGTSSMFYAWKTALNYSFKTFRVGMNYERIDPGYQTLGGLFFNNDIENYTFTPAISLFKGKISLTANTGLQKNNLSKDKAAETKRWVASLNLTAQLFKGMSTNLSYSNFSAFTRNNPQINPFTNQVTYLDTFNVYQISESFNSSLNYGFGSKNKTTLALTFAKQTSSNITGKLDNANAFGIRAHGAGTPANTYVGTASYSYGLVDKKITIACNGNANYSILTTGTVLFIGPSLNLTKNYGKNKPAFTGGITYNRNYLSGILTNNVFNYRLSASYAPKLIDEKKGTFTFSLSSVMLHKLPVSNDLNKIHELTVVANVSYNFK